MALYDKLKPLLWDGVGTPKESYSQLCAVLVIGRDRGIINRDTRVWLHDQIRMGLYGKATVFSWAYDNGYLKDMSQVYAKRQVQLFRHRWLKHLCEEYERENAVR